MSFSPMQQAFLQNCNHRWNIKTGATRSGKTFLDYTVIPKRLEKCQDQGLIVLLGNTKGTLERNILDPMRNLWGDELVGQIGSNNKVQLFGKTCYALGADKVSQVAKIQGAAIEYCYGDEITTWAEPVFQMLKSRLSCANSHFDGTCNPDSPGHWLKAFLGSGADIYQQAYTIDDNPFLTPSFVASLKQEYAGTVYYKRYIQGLWAKAEGLVYAFDEGEHVTDTVPERGRYFISCDYGTMNPFSAGLWCVGTDGVAVRIREYYYNGRKEGRQKTDEDYYQALVDLAGTHAIESVVVDPSAASFIATIRKHGQFSVRRAKNDVADGIRRTASFLATGRILIHQSCQDAINEFGLYAWDEKAAADTVIKEHDHAMDDIRYFCNTILRRC